VVTSDEDNAHNPSPGSLRCGVSLGGSNLGSGISSTGAAGAWITFSRDMIISLHDMLWIRSSTTIDGRGFNITIAGK
jgi:pectate lyase